MSRFLSFVSSGFSACFAVLLVLELLAASSSVVADEPLVGPNFADGCPPILRIADVREMVAAQDIAASVMGTWTVSKRRVVRAWARKTARTARHTQIAVIPTDLWQAAPTTFNDKSAHAYRSWLLHSCSENRPLGIWLMRRLTGSESLS
jgi:hypothetical protein